MLQPDSPVANKADLLDYSIKVEGQAIFLNGTLLESRDMHRLLRPYMSRLNTLLVRASTLSTRKTSPEQVAEEIGKIMGVQTRVHSGRFEVYCNDTNTWKLVDSFSEQECSSCKKAKLIRQLSLLDSNNGNGRINTSTPNL